MVAWLVHASLLTLCLSFGIFSMCRLGWTFIGWLPFEALFAYHIGSFAAGPHLPFIPPVHYLSPPYQPPTDWMAYIPPYLLIWPIDNTLIGLLTDYILVIVGVVLGIIGIGRGWGCKAWIPLGVFSLIITVLIALGAYNRSYMAMGYITVWLILMTIELLGVVLGIIGMGRGWGHKAWIPLVVLSVPIDFIFLFAITYTTR